MLESTLLSLNSILTVGYISFPYIPWLEALQNSTDVNETSSLLFRAKWKEHVEQRKTGYVGTVFVTSPPLKVLYPSFILLPCRLSSVEFSESNINQMT